METCRLLLIRQDNRALSRFGFLCQLAIHCRRQAVAIINQLILIGPHRLLVGKTADHPVRGLVVELPHMGMDIELAGKAILRVVTPAVGQDHVDAVIDIRAVDQRHAFLFIGHDLGLFFLEDINQTILIDDRRTVADCL